MSEDEDLRARLDALEARLDALTDGTDATAPPGAPAAEPTSRGAVTRRGLLSAAAGAVAGGAAAALVTTTQDGGVDAHVEGSSGAHAASAISFEPSGDLVATDVRTALADLDARLAGLLQYSPDALQDHAVLYDELFGASIADGQVGGLGWSVVTADGGTLMAATGPRPDTPGWYELQTGTTSATGSCALHLDEVSLAGHPLFVWEARIVPLTVNEDGQTSTWRIGLHDDAQGGDPDNGFYFEQAGGATAVRCRTAQGGTRTDEDAGIDLEAGRPYRLRIASDGGGVAYFSVDDEVVATITDRLPSTPQEAFGPCLGIVKTAGTGTSHSVLVDYVYLLWAVSR